jgi:hypothetical protein
MAEPPGGGALVDLLTTLGSGRYTCVSVRGEAGRETIVRHPPPPGTPTLVSADGDETIYVFRFRDGSWEPEPGETVAMGEGMEAFGVEVAVLGRPGDSASA